MSGCSSSLVAASKGSLLEEARRTWFSYQRQVMSKIFSTVLIITCGPLHVCLSHLCSHTCPSHLLQLSRIHSMGLIGLLEWTIQFSISLGMMLLHFVNGVEKDCLQKLNGSMPAGLAYRTSMWTWLHVLVMKRHFYNKFYSGTSQAYFLTTESMWNWSLDCWFLC